LLEKGRYFERRCPERLCRISEYWETAGKRGLLLGYFKRGHKMGRKVLDIIARKFSSFLLTEKMG
jgi:hypothetical protein